VSSTLKIGEELVAEDVGLVEFEETGVGDGGVSGVVADRQPAPKRVRSPKIEKSFEMLIKS